MSDPFGGFVNDQFELKINAKPAIPTTGSYVNVDKEFRMSQGLLTIRLNNHFTDPDSVLGDILTYQIRQASGLSVGSWVTINSNTGLLNFNAGINNVGWNYFVVTATDRNAATFT